MNKQKEKNLNGLGDSMAPKLDIPDNLKVKNHNELPGDVEVVDTNDEVIDVENMVAASQRLGMTTISPEQLKAIHAMGVATDGVGVVTMANGYAQVTMQSLAAIVLALTQQIPKCNNQKQLSDLTYPLGYAADKMAKVMATVTKGKVQLAEAAPASGSGQASNHRQSFSPMGNVFINVGKGDVTTEEKPVQNAK